HLRARDPQRRNAQLVALGEARIRRRAAPVHPDLSAAHDAVDVALGDALQSLDEVVVEALALALFAHGDPPHGIRRAGLHGGQGRPRRAAPPATIRRNSRGIRYLELDTAPILPIMMAATRCATDRQALPGKDSCVVPSMLRFRVFERT